MKAVQVLDTNRLWRGKTCEKGTFSAWSEIREAVNVEVLRCVKRGECE